MKQLFAIVTMLFLISCEKEERHLDIYYLPQNMTSAVSIDCRWVQPSMYQNVKNIIIRDEDFGSQFNTYYGELNESDGIYPPDVRIRILYHHGTQTDTICMGEHFGIMVNGQQKEDSSKLLKLIKDQIYKK